MHPSWGDASTILRQAGVREDTSYYRRFTAADEKAALTVAMRIQAAWRANDADRFADVFAENGSLLMKDTQLRSREEIRRYMADGFAGPFQGAHVEGGPVAVTFPAPDVAMLVTEGGIVMPGADGIAAADRIRAVWVIASRPEGPCLISHQSSPVKG